MNITQSKTEVPREGAAFNAHKPHKAHSFGMVKEQGFQVPKTFKITGIPIKVSLTPVVFISALARS